MSHILIQIGSIINKTEILEARFILLGFHPWGARGKQNKNKIPSTHVHLHS
jgi:hypothetical protein